MMRILKIGRSFLIGLISLAAIPPAAIAATYSGGRYLRGCRLIDQVISDGGPSLAYLLRHNARDYADSDGNPILGSINGEFGDLPTIWAETLPTEDRYLATAADALDRWRDDGFDSAEAYRLHQQMATDALEQLTHLAESLLATP